MQDRREIHNRLSFFIGRGAVSWKSKKKSVITTSSVQAEYLAMCAAQECTWISRRFAFVTAIAIPQPGILVDNQRAIKMAKNDVSGNRTKHIDLNYHLVRGSFNEKS